MRTSIETPAGRAGTLPDSLGRELASFLIRPFVPSDRPALEQFYEQFQPKRAAQGLPPDGLERIRRWLDPVLARGIHLVAIGDGELIGHAFVVPSDRPGVGEYAVFLRRDMRGRGLGTELNRAAVEAARTAGLMGLWLTVEPRNRPAVRSYEKVGFRFIPETTFSLEAEMELNL
jgi:RimJ/RimL family protein N-acetyltransferase